MFVAYSYISSYQSILQYVSITECNDRHMSANNKTRHCYRLCCNSTLVSTSWLHAGFMLWSRGEEQPHKTFEIHHDFRPSQFRVPEETINKYYRHLQTSSSSIDMTLPIIKIERLWYLATHVMSKSGCFNYLLLALLGGLHVISHWLGTAQSLPFKLQEFFNDVMSFDYDVKLSKI